MKGNQQTVLKPLPIRNPVAAYKIVIDDLKRLEAEKARLRGEIFSRMDAEGIDVLSCGDYKAERTVIVQAKLDTQAVRDFLGPKVSEFEKMVESIRLTVI